MYIVRGETGKKTNDFQARHFVLLPEIWKDVSDASKRKKKQKWAIEKSKLENARRFRGICFIDSDDEEFKDIMRKRVESWKFRCPVQCFANFNVTSRETCRTVEEHKTKDACIGEADECMRKSMEGSHHKNHEEEKG